MVEKWLKSFARVSLPTCLFIGIVGIISLIASFFFSIMGTGTIEVQREPLVWLGVALALFSVSLGCLAVHLSFKNSLVGGENTSSDKINNELDRAINEVLDDIDDISESTKKRLGNNPEDIDNWSIRLTYVSAKRLLKHSKALNRWTIVIAVFTVVFGLSTIWSIIDKHLF